VYGLWVDSSAISGGTFGFDWNIIGAGDMKVTAFTPNPAALLTFNLNTTADTFQGSRGDRINGNFTPLELGTLTISLANVGDITLWTGDYIDANHNTLSATAPQVLAITFIPEPGTLLLLGVGMGGLAVAVRARRQRVR
jgi:hypothetical protein